MHVINLCILNTVNIAFPSSVSNDSFNNIFFSSKLRYGSSVYVWDITIFSVVDLILFCVCYKIINFNNY